MSRTFRVRTRINKPLTEVFNAVQSREILVKYFSDRANSDMLEGETIVWNWDGAGDHPVRVTRVVKNELIEFVFSSKDWHKTTEAFDVTVVMTFEALNDTQTMLSISETGWADTQEGISGSYDNCEGWTHMAGCLKAYLEYGIDLRWMA